MLAFLAMLLSFGPPSLSQQVPTGFVDELVTGGFSQPVGMAFTSDGRMIVVEKNTARIHVATPGASSVMGVVPGVAVAHTEQGLLGVAVDPAWPTWPYVYVMYNHASPASVRVLRYTVSGDLNDPQSLNLTVGSPYFILDDIPDAAPIHNGGTLRFGPDGMLYVSSGDDLGYCNAQDLESLNGKILRLDVAAVHGQTGTGPPPKSMIAATGNPFSGPNSRLVWSYGLRNPFRFNIDPVNGALFISDVGTTLFEELNHSDAPGSDFGWPLFEGPSPIQSCPGPQGTLTAPIATYPNPGGSSIISFGGAHRNLPGASFAFGSAYEESVFFVDFFQGFVRRLEKTGSTWTAATPVPGQPDQQNWGTGFFAVSDAMQGPDGAIYYVRMVPGSVRRIRPAGSAVLFTVVSGDLQAGNAGWPLFEPLRVQITDPFGSPISGQPVTFSVLSGGGQLDPQPVMTAADGTAQTDFTLPLATSSNPILIQAVTPGASPLLFSITWRGLVADYDPLADVLNLSIRHSQAGVPFTLVVQPAPPILWGTAWGDILVDLWSPPPGFVTLDGLGFFGPPNPLATFGPSVPTFDLQIPNLQGPPGGALLVAQAFALDTSRFPALSVIMISNGAFILLN